MENRAKFVQTSLMEIFLQLQLEKMSELLQNFPSLPVIRSDRQCVAKFVVKVKILTYQIREIRDGDWDIEMSLCLSCGRAFLLKLG